MQAIIIFAIVFITVPLVGAQMVDYRTLSDDAPVVYLCQQDSSTPEERQWTKNVAASLNRLRRAVYNSPENDFGIEITQFGKCRSQTGIDWQGTACFGRRGAVYCNANALGKVLHATAWLSTAFAVPQLSWMIGKRYSRRQFTPATVGISLAEASKAGKDRLRSAAFELLTNWGRGTPDEAIIIESTLFAIREGDVQQVYIPSDDAEYYSYNLYKAASNYLMAYVIGHELGHAFARCVVPQPSWSETSRVFNRLSRLQSEGKILCPAPLLLAEMNADKCALRNVASIDGFMLKEISHNTTSAKRQALFEMLSQSRRIAIDALEGMLDFGLDTNVEDSFYFKPLGKSDLKLTVTYPKPRPGYFYPAIRLFLFSSLLNTLEPKHKSLVSLCGDTAQRAINGLTFSSVSPCKDIKEIPKEDEWGHFVEPFGQFVPPKLKRGWQSGKWEFPPRKNFICTVTLNKAIEAQISNSIKLGEDYIDTYFEKHPHETVNALSEMGDIYYKNKKFGNAINIVQKILPMYKKLAENDRNRYHLYAASTLNNLGLIKADLGQRNEGLEYLQQTLAMALDVTKESIVYNSPWSADMIYKLIQSAYYNIGKCLELEEFDRFMLKLNEVQEIYHALEKEDLSFYKIYVSKIEEDKAKWYAHLGNRYSQVSALHKAINFHQKSLQIYESLTQDVSGANNYEPVICEQAIQISELYLKLLHKDKDNKKNYEKMGLLFLEKADIISKNSINPNSVMCQFQVNFLKGAYEQIGTNIK